MVQSGRKRVPFAKRIEALRPRVLLGIVGLVIATPQCVWTDLEVYSSEFGDVGQHDAGSSDGSDVMPAPEAGACECLPGQECVNGTCETCLPTWSYDHKGLRQGDQRGIDHAYDPARKMLYVASARQDGQDPARAYLAELHTCRGTLVKEVDGPMVDGQTVPGLQVLRRHGNSYYAKLRQESAATSTGGYAVYDAVTSLFTRLERAPRFSMSSQTEELWSLEVTKAGKVWMYGAWRDSAGALMPLAFRSDGAGGGCSSDYPNFVGSMGRVIAVNNDDVYMMNPLGAEVRVLHFKDSACDIASCNCPVADELPPLVLPSWSNTLAAKVVGNSLVVVGFYGTTDIDWVGFVAQYNFVGQAWGKPYVFDPTPSLDGFTALDSDGSTVYAAAFQNYDPNNPNISGMEVLVFGLPITDLSQPKKIAAPNIRGAYAITFDEDGLFLTGYNPTNAANGRTMRCTLDACP